MYTKFITKAGDHKSGFKGKLQAKAENLACNPTTASNCVLKHQCSLAQQTYILHLLYGIDNLTVFKSSLHSRLFFLNVRSRFEHYPIEFKPHVYFPYCGELPDFRAQYIKLPSRAFWHPFWKQRWKRTDMCLRIQINRSLLPLSEYSALHYCTTYISLYITHKHN